LVRQVGPLPPPPNLKSGQLIEIMASDKKARGGTLRFVLPRAIGQVDTISGVSEASVRGVLDELREESSRPAMSRASQRVTGRAGELTRDVPRRRRSELAICRPDVRSGDDCVRLPQPGKLCRGNSGIAAHSTAGRLGGHYRFRGTRWAIVWRGVSILFSPSSA